MFPLEQQINHLRSRQDSPLDTACLKTLEWLQQHETTIKQALAPDAPKKVEQGKSETERSVKKSDCPQQSSLDEKMKNAATAAAIHCKDPLFQRFMEAEWHNNGFNGKLSDEAEERCAGQVRAICLVKSRAQLSKYKDSFIRWNRLLKKYYFWKENE